jgi:hypothetical protein
MSDAHACDKPAYREQPAPNGPAPPQLAEPVAQQASESQRYATRAAQARLDAIQGYFNHTTPEEHAPASRRNHLDRQQPARPGRHSMPSDKHANVVARHGTSIAPSGRSGRRAFLFGVRVR